MTKPALTSPLFHRPSFFPAIFSSKTWVCFAALCFAFLPAAKAADASWQWAGWGGGGWFWCSVADPSNPNIFYMGADCGGAYKSVDGGRSWTIVNNGLSNYGVYSLAIAKSNPQTVFAMTLDGICKSVDGAASWTVLEATQKHKLDLCAIRNVSLHGIAVDPTNANIIYAPNVAGDLFKSIDGGTTWNKLQLGGNSDAELANKMASGDIVSIGDFQSGNDGWEASTDYDKLLFYARPSQDFVSHGKFSLGVDVRAAAGTWKDGGRLDKKFGGKDFSAFKSLSVRLYIPEGAPKMVVTPGVQTGPTWVWTQGPQQELEPGKWTDVHMDLTKVPNMNALQIIHLVFRSPYGAYGGQVYMGSALMNKSSTPINFNSGPVSVIAIAQDDPKTVFVSTLGKGIFKSTDAGATWQPLAGVPAHAVGVTLAPSNKNIVYGAFNNGESRAGELMKSTDGGATWSTLHCGDSAHYIFKDIAVAATDPQKVICTTVGPNHGTVCESQDGGATWQMFSKLKRDYQSAPAMPDGTPAGLAIAPGGKTVPETDIGQNGGGEGYMCELENISPTPDFKTIFIAGDWDNIISRDGGATWVESSKGADNTVMQDLCFCDNSVYAVAMDQGLFQSDDDGANWKALFPLALDFNYCGDLDRVYANDQNGTRRILATSTLWLKDKPARVFLSEDGGKTFETIRAGLPDYLTRQNIMYERGRLRGLAVDPTNTNVIYLGMDGDPGGGVFKTTDGGKTWNHLPAQPAARKILRGFAIDPTDHNRLFWGACGKDNGVYVSPDGGASWSKTGLSGEVYNLTVTPNGTIFADGAKVWKSSDHGATWQTCDCPSSGFYIGMASDPSKPCRVFVSTTATWDGEAKGGIYMSEDGGATWINITRNIPTVVPGVLVYNPKTGELWAGGTGIFKLKI